MMNGSEINRAVFPIILAVLSFICVFLFIYILFYGIGYNKIKTISRLKKLFVSDMGSVRYVNKAKKEKKRENSRLSKLKLMDIIANELLMADVMMRPEEFINLWLLATFVPSGLTAIIGGNAALAVTLAALGAILPPLYLKKQKSKRITIFENQLGDALVVISNCLRSGLTFQQAMENIAREMPDPISREFTRVIREINYGSTVDRALNNMAERIKSADLMLTVSAILIQRQVGGNLSEILDNISGTIKERIKLKDEIKVLTATGRMSGTVVGLLPVAIGLILLLLNPDYIKTFFETDLGIMMLVAAGVLEAVGFIFVRKIVSIKY